MRFGFLIPSALLLGSLLGHASTLMDPFAQPQGHCDLSATAPYTSCDVIGDPRLFDIQSLSFSSSNGIATVLIALNSGAVKNVNNHLTLGPFTDSGLSLIPGDIFFYNPNTIYDPSDPLTEEYLQYGVSLSNHGSFAAGGLYAIGGTVSVETAQTALNDSGDYYRRNQVVLMAGSGTPLSTSTVNVASTGNGTTSAQYTVSLNIPTTSGLFNLMTTGQIGILFSAADCGNDVIQGTATVTPEPEPAILMGIGLALLLGGRAWRKHTA